jgi:hypothetical protein
MLEERRIGSSCGIFPEISGCFKRTLHAEMGRWCARRTPYLWRERARAYPGFHTPTNARRRCRRQFCKRQLHKEFARPTTVVQVPQRECCQRTLCCGEVFHSRDSGRAIPVATSRAGQRPIESCSPACFWLLRVTHIGGQWLFLFLFFPNTSPDAVAIDTLYQ